MSLKRRSAVQTVTLKHDDWSIGRAGPLAVVAGLSVLEDIGLALEIGTDLKSVCADLSLPFAFKASYDKANRSSISSYRGPGLTKGLDKLAHVKFELGASICTDAHLPEQCTDVACSMSALMAQI